VANGGTGVTSSTGTGSVVLSTSPTLVTPALGSPTSGDFSAGAFTWPTFNQNTTGTAGGLSGSPSITVNALTATSATVGGDTVVTNNGALWDIFTSGVRVSINETNSDFKIPFTSTTTNTAGNYSLRMDTASTFTYNPSTSTLVVANVTGNASTATLATAVAYLPNRTDSAAYPVVWGAAYTSGSGTIAYSCAAVTIQSSTGTLNATNLVASGTVSDGTAVIRPIVSGTAVATTSGTIFDFTGIPSWVKRVTLNLNEVGVTGTGIILVQLIHSGGTVTTTGYVASCTRNNGTSASQANNTTGFPLIPNSGTATAQSNGSLIISNLTGNTWAGNGGFSTSSFQLLTSGAVPLGGTLSGIRLTVTAGTFDSGVANIMYE
jgi:hypothetical protein